MKLLYVLAAFLALSLGEDTDQQEIEDSEAVATVELLKTSPDVLQTAASSYNYYPNENSKYVELKNSVPYYPPNPNNNYNQQNYPNLNNNYPNQNNYYPENSYTTQKPYAPPQNDYIPPNNNYIPPNNNYVPPNNNYVPPNNNYVPPNNNYVPPNNNYVPPNNNYVPPNNNYVPPNNNYVPPVNDYVPPNNGWYPPASPTSTTPSSVIKNDVFFGSNGSYKYEYEIADGTHASEEGYVLYPNTEYASPVKRGWYSYKGPDGKVYTVTWWADHTGFHASGDHIPTPPPIPPAIQASIEQNAKEEAEKEAQNNIQPTYPTQTQKPQTGYYPTQAPYPSQPTYTPQQNYPPQQTYYPPQQTYPQQNKPSYGK
ncbi:uncharacterized protein LOC128676181 [Plodia interpunctella]|uniref:uncharacterized protein LOC128676181 n=1 Tax=Plodia interpunctella TaxID=58824 RepID=UPI0023684724|nr:uncharacterized protein LOC128676181 [Plodia interpunctella]